MYITEIQSDFDGDVFFPEFDRGDWVETQRDKHISDDDSRLEYHFVILDRKDSSAFPGSGVKTKMVK
jgi:dihydrofolate reductase